MIKTFVKSCLFFSLLMMVTCFYYFILFYERISYALTGQSYTTHIAHRLCTRWGQALFRFTPGWRMDAQGLENIPPSGAFVVVANHESATDILAIYLLGIQFRWLSKDSIFKLPLLGRAMTWAGYVSIERGNKHSHIKALEQSAHWIKQGVPMLFFPEGTRSTSGQPKEFKSGAFKLAKDCNVGILPITLLGAGKLLKKGSLAPHKATVRVFIAPLTFPRPDEDTEAFTKRVELQIKESHRRLRQQHADSTSSAIDLSLQAQS